MASEREGDDDERKERVLHARIPESLDEALRSHAARLGVSVSNLVRNALTSAFGVVEGLAQDTAEWAHGARAGARVDEPRVLAWQAATLAVNAVCERCNAILKKGRPAAISLAERPGGRARVRCDRCAKEPSDD